MPGDGIHPLWPKVIGSIRALALEGISAARNNQKWFEERCYWNECCARQMSPMREEQTLSEVTIATPDENGDI